MDLSNYLAKPNKTIDEHNADLLEGLNQLYRLGYMEERLYKLTKKACVYHDYGKVNKEFQRRVKANDKKIPFNEEKEVVHNVLSAYFIDANEFEEMDDYYRVAHAVLNHHNYEDVYKALLEKAELIKQLLAGFETFDIKGKSKIRQIVGDQEAIKIKGFLHKCDYSASAGYQIEYENDFLENNMERLLQTWQKKNPNAGWNELQLFCIEHRQENVIAIAQTGMGKTEAGLHWIGNAKGYFVLPLRTAINAIYSRIKDDILPEERVNERLSLLHSESLEYYMKNIEDKNIDLFDYYNRGKQMSVPLNISTMDQLFDFVFKYQGHELMLTTLSYSKIVIDEIQMYSPDVLAYLIAGLEKIYEMGGKIAILTATLSPFIKDRLKKIPFVEGVFINNEIRHHVKVIQNIMTGKGVYEIVKRNKVLVVCNTIKKAQQIYQELKELIEENGGNMPVHLLHSRYIREERAEKEKEILEFGRTFTEQNELDVREGIWISTSLVEASLDIDFDCLFTELQDLNSLFQRFGRCNRKGLKRIQEPNCYVYTEIEDNAGFIDETIFAISQKAVSALDGPISESDKIKLIEDNLTTDNLRGSAYMEQYKESYYLIQNIDMYEYQKDENKLRNIMTEIVIPSPVYTKHAEEIQLLETEYCSGKASFMRKTQIKEEIMKYTVNVPLYRFKQYEREKNAIKFKPICLGAYHKIFIMESYYDELGFRFMNYKEAIREVNLL